MKNRKHFALSCLLAGGLTAWGSARADGIPAGYQLVYAQDFETPQALNDFVFANPDNWSITQHDGNGALECAGDSQYKPELRSPLNIVLLTHRRVGDFVLECDMLQTGKGDGVRDLCLFFNFQAPDSYYYCRLAPQTETQAHNIFIVNGKPCLKMSATASQGVEWGRDKWHKVRLVRDCQAGTIEVYFDDMRTPVMTANDTTFKEGWTGFGSFEGTGRIDNVKLYAPGALTTWRPSCFPSKPAVKAEPQPKIDGSDFEPLFDGKTLKGWKALNGTATFAVEEGCIVGASHAQQKINTYLSTEKSYGDFIFAFDVKFEKLGNSGIQIRSRERDGDRLVTGYQIEIDDSDRQWTGGLYEERGRGWMTPLAGDGQARQREAFKRDAWNTIVIKARDTHIQTWVNGMPIADYYDNDKELAASEGFIGLQVHWPVAGKAGKLRWRNLRIKELSERDGE
jgi:hypothetical protein